MTLGMLDFESMILKQRTMCFLSTLCSVSSVSKISATSIATNANGGF